MILLITYHLASHLMWNYLISSNCADDYTFYETESKTGNKYCVMPPGVLVFVRLPQYEDLPEVKFKMPHLF